MSNKLKAEIYFRTKYIQYMIVTENNISRETQLNPKMIHFKEIALQLKDTLFKQGENVSFSK